MKRFISSFVGVVILGGLRMALAQAPAESHPSPTMWKSLNSLPSYRKIELPQAALPAKPGLSAQKDAVPEETHLPQRNTDISSKPRLTYLRDDKKNPNPDSPDE